MSTVVSRLHQHAAERPTAEAYAEKVQGHWQTTSWQDFDAQVRRVGRALLHLGVPAGGTVGILGSNRPEWVLGCLGTLSVGAVPAGIYQTCAPNQVAYILEHASSSVVIVEDVTQWEKIRKVRDQLPELHHVVFMRGEVPPDNSILSWEDFLALGDQVEENVREEREATIDRAHLATLIYTSGTTGTPKAVMISHRNLFETARIGAALHRLAPSDRVVSYLPLAHIAEQMISVHTAVYVGYEVYYAEAPEHLADNLREAQPTLVFGVPRVWERICSVIREKAKAAPAYRQKLLHWAMGVGQKVTKRRNSNRPVRGLLALRYKLADRLVLSKARQRLGMDRTRIACCGAAPIRRDVLEFFAGLGISIYEVWGLSECSGPGTWNYAGNTRIGTVGPPLPEVEVRIAEDDEVLVRGPNVFQGYLKDPEATAQALIDGWLHTGDMGTLDGEGFLTITGRKKELIITSGGKNIAPAGIEALLKQHELISEAVVIGDDRRFLTALLTLDEETSAGFARERGLQEPHYKNATVLAAVQKGVDATNRQVARVETVRDFRILPRSLSLEEGELTPTLKVKRRAVHDHFAHLIEEMYSKETQA